MDRPQVNIFGGCELVVFDRGPHGKRARVIDLFDKELGLRPDDYALLALLAVKGGCSRLECIRRLWREYDALVTRAEEGDALHPDQHTELRKVSDRLNRSASRLRDVLREEIHADVVPVERRRQFAGTLSLDLERLDVDYHRVRGDLVGKKGTGASQAFAPVRGDILDEYGHRALHRLRQEALVELRDWLSASTYITQHFDLRERGTIARELLDCGSSRTYNSIATRLQLAKRPSNGVHTLPMGVTQDGLLDYAIPEIAPAELTQVARDTFRETLKSWLTDHELVVTTGSATVYADISARWDTIGSIPFKVDVLAPDQAPQHREIGGDVYWAAPIGAKQVKALRSAAESSELSYLALAIPRKAGCRREDLYDLPLAERFSWWLICAQDYFSSDLGDQHDAEVLFPLQNTWNLSMCSLVWAARWVQEFYEPLMRPGMVPLPHMADKIDTVFTADPDFERALEMGWGHLVKDLPNASGEVDEKTFKKICLSLGLGAALQLICAQLSDPVLGRQTQIRTYTPEALFGTISMWLFSRSYHQFMQISGVRGVGQNLEANQRFMPVFGDDPVNFSRLHRAALWNVIVLYRMCGVDVRIIPEPEEPNFDRAFYGKDIGYFQWMAFDSAGGEWQIDQTNKDVQNGYRDFFLEKEGEALIDGAASEDTYSSICALQSGTLTLDARKPRWLLPREDGFIQHPWLWVDNHGAAARLRQARHRGP
jgi:hypothetical protein